MYSDLLAGPGGNASPATVRHLHATLRSALNTAVKRRLVPWNPAQHVELPAHARPATQVWTPQQLGAFLNSIADHRLSAFFHLISFAGLRRGEALGLAWDDVDFDRRTNRVRRQLVDAGQRAYLGEPKTRSGTRHVPLDDYTVEVLRVHADHQRVEHEQWGSGWHGTGLAFTREDGSPFRPEYLTHLFNRLVQSSGLPRI